MLGISLLVGMETFRNNAIQYVELIDMIILVFKDIIDSLLNFTLPDQSIDAVESVAVSLTGLFLAMEMITHLSSMRMEGRIEDALQLGIKLVVAKIIIENTHVIMGGLYDLFNGLGLSAIGNGFEAVRNAMPGSLETYVDNNKGMIGEGWILICLVLFIVSIVTAGMLFMVTIQIVGIIFEIAIHQAVGAIALSTLCNSTMRSTGLSFIKSYSAVCLQTTVIGAIFKVFGTISNQLIINTGEGSTIRTSIENAGAFGAIFMYLTPIFMMIILGVTVNKSGEITKRMFGA